MSSKDNIVNAGEAFYRSVLEWKEIVDKDSKDPKGQLAQTVMHAQLHHCFKDLFQIGAVTMPAIHFCGSVNAKAMLPQGTTLSSQHKLLKQILPQKSLQIFPM